MQDQDTQIKLDLVLHGSWSDGAFFVWGESAEPAPKPPGRQPRVRVRPHPYAASPDRLREALETLAPLGAWADAPATTRVILLPSSADRPHLPPWLVPDADAETADDADRNHPAEPETEPTGSLEGARSGAGHRHRPGPAGHLAVGRGGRAVVGQ